MLDNFLVCILWQHIKSFGNHFELIYIYIIMLKNKFLHLPGRELWLIWILAWEKMGKWVSLNKKTGKTFCISYLLSFEMSYVHSPGFLFLGFIQTRISFLSLGFMQARVHVLFLWVFRKLGLMLVAKTERLVICFYLCFLIHRVSIFVSFSRFMLAKVWCWKQRRRSSLLVSFSAFYSFIFPMGLCRLGFCFFFWVLCGLGLMLLATTKRLVIYFYLYFLIHRVLFFVSYFGFYAGYGLMLEATTEKLVIRFFLCFFIHLFLSMSLCRVGFCFFGFYAGYGLILEATTEKLVIRFFLCFLIHLFLSMSLCRVGFCFFLCFLFIYFFLWVYTWYDFVYFSGFYVAWVWC